MDIVRGATRCCDVPPAQCHARHARCGGVSAGFGYGHGLGCGLGVLELRPSGPPLATQRRAISVVARGMIGTVATTLMTRAAASI